MLSHRPRRGATIALVDLICVLRKLVQRIFARYRLRLIPHNCFLRRFPSNNLIPQFFATNVRHFPGVDASHPSDRTIQYTDIFGLIRYRYPFQRGQLPLPTRHRHGGHAATQRRSFSIDIVRLRVGLIHFGTPIVHRHRARRTIVRRDNSVPTLGASTRYKDFITFIGRFETRVRSDDPPAILLVSLGTSITISYELFDYTLESPGVSSESSSAHLDSEIGSVQHNVPSRGGSILI